MRKQPYFLLEVFGQTGKVELAPAALAEYHELHRRDDVRVIILVQIKPPPSCVTAATLMCHCRHPLHLNLWWVHLPS